MPLTRLTKCVRPRRAHKASFMGKVVRSRNKEVARRRRGEEEEEEEEEIAIFSGRE